MSIVIVILCIILYTALMLFPLIGSMLGLKKPDVSALINIKQDTVREPRYFGKSFAVMMQKGLADYDGSGKLKLSRVNDLLMADEADLPDVCKALVYAKKTFEPQPGIKFVGEIYCENGANLINIPSLRAVYARGPIQIGAGTTIVRWVDCEETIVIYDRCDLGISVTSAARVIIGVDAVFRRLYAPVIHTGVKLSGKALPTESRSAQRGRATDKPILRNIRYIDERTDPDSETEVKGSVISKHSVTVLGDMTLLGHIRSHKSVTVLERACVHGNIFAEGDIYIGHDARVFGDVFTQENLYVDEGAVLGQYGEIKSFIARGEITVERGCRIHGYMSAEKRGLCCPDPNRYLNFDEEPEAAAMPEEYTAPAVLPVMESAAFANSGEFDNMSAQVFRKNSRLREVVIPEGVTAIRGSFFYECGNLETVRLPSTLRSIDDYAFYGCRSLSDINLKDCGALEHIGEHAFYGCVSLAAIDLSGSLQSLGEAAFYGCDGLLKLSFGDLSDLSELPSHVFFGCGALKEIELPSGIAVIGVSAFYGCSSLAELVIPDSAARIGSYAFYGCSSLKKLVVPANVQDIGDNAFSGCGFDTPTVQIAVGGK